MYKKKCSVADELRDKFIIDMCNSNFKEYFKKYDAYIKQYIKQYIDEEVERRVNEAMQKHNFRPYPGDAV
jgi:hypothetical protein